MAGLTKKQLAAIHANDKLPHTQHATMTIKDAEGKTQGRVEIDVFGKPMPKARSKMIE